MIDERDYNYATFPSDDDPELFANFFEHLKPGEAAPDPELLDLDSNQRVQLSEITKRGLMEVPARAGARDAFP